MWEYLPKASGLDLTVRKGTGIWLQPRWYPALVYLKGDLIWSKLWFWPKRSINPTFNQKSALPVAFHVNIFRCSPSWVKELRNAANNYCWRKGVEVNTLPDSLRTALAYDLSTDPRWKSRNAMRVILTVSQGESFGPCTWRIAVFRTFWIKSSVVL